jgi:hypothetical protein
LEGNVIRRGIAAIAAWWGDRQSRREASFAPLLATADDRERQARAARNMAGRPLMVRRALIYAELRKPDGRRGYGD